MLILTIEGPGFPDGAERVFFGGVPVVTIGRGPDNDIVLPDPERFVSRRHCTITFSDDAFLLTDRSTNGTFLDGSHERIDSVPLTDGTIFNIGTYRLTARLVDDTETTADEDATSAAARTTRVLATLTPLEKRVLRMRFGIGADADQTLEEVGQQFSVTRERMKQIEAKALRKLKHPSRSRKLRNFLDEPAAEPVDASEADTTDDAAMFAEILSREFGAPAEPSSVPKSRRDEAALSDFTSEQTQIRGDKVREGIEAPREVTPAPPHADEGSDAPRDLPPDRPAETPASARDKVSEKRSPRVIVNYSLAPPEPARSPPSRASSDTPNGKSPSASERASDAIRNGATPHFSETRDPATADYGLDASEALITRRRRDPAKSRLALSLPTLRRPRGRALFRIPRRMWIEQDELAELRISPRDILTVEDRAALESTMVGRGRTTEEHAVTRIGRRMRARLHADGDLVQIHDLSSEAQETDLTEALQWNWRVRPRRTGQVRITLQVTVLRDEEGQETTVDAQALHVIVNVAVRSLMTRPRRFLRDNWQWLASSSGGLAAAGAAYAVWLTIAGG